MKFYAPIRESDLVIGQSLTLKLGTLFTSSEILCAKLDMEARINAEARACTGLSAVHPRSRDIKIANFSITFFGAEMLQDTTLELNCGRRYGLIGLNGCGKSSLLAVLGNREVPIPDHIDIFHLSREIPASSKTALECVSPNKMFLFLISKI